MPPRREPSKERSYGRSSPAEEEQISVGRVTRSRAKKHQEEEEVSTEVTSSKSTKSTTKTTSTTTSKRQSTTSTFTPKRGNKNGVPTPSPSDENNKPVLTAFADHKLTRRQPTDAPPFTLQDLRDEIKDLFVRPLYKTMYFIFRDLFFVTTWFFLNCFILKAALFISTQSGQYFNWDLSPIAHITFLPFQPQLTTFSYLSFIAQSPTALVNAPWQLFFTSPVVATFIITLSVLAWNYVYWMGHFFTGLLIIAHECGHKALFDYIWLGHIFGWIFHSFLFIPYFSWSFTHRNHHTFNKNQAFDEAHILAHVDDVFPSLSREFGPDYHPTVQKKPRQGKFFESFKSFCCEVHDNLIEFSFPYRVIYMILYATIGFPLYLFMNASGRKYPASTIPPNHWSPNSPVFHDGEGLYVILSNIGILLNCTWIYIAIQKTSLATVFLYYFMPYLHCHFYFVVYTLCHHSSPSLPTYSGDKWNYLQGALSTIDRTHGALIDNLWHYISRTHVIHHVFSDLPFYHSWEATERLKPILGDYYMFTDEDDRWFGAILALWNHIRDGTFIAEDDHPALLLVATALETAKTNQVELESPIVENAVKAVLPIALANDPHKDGRNVDKEIFWQRTLQL